MNIEAQISIGQNIQAGSASLALAIITINEASYESSDKVEDRRAQILQHLRCAEQHYSAALDEMSAHNKPEPEPEQSPVRTDQHGDTQFK